MLKIASRVLDFHDDVSGDVARGLPAELHDCEVAGHEQLEALHNHQFGLLVKIAGGRLERRYPCDTEDHRKLSMAYLERAGTQVLPTEVVEKVRAKLASADALVSAPYFDAESYQAPVKKAFAEKCWGLVLDGVNAFPLHTPELVKEAAARFRETTRTMDLQDSFLYARNLDARASALDVKVSGAHQIYTNPGLNKVALAAALDQRRKIANLAVLDEIEQESGIFRGRAEDETDGSYRYRQAKAASGRLAVDQIVALLLQYDKVAGITDHHYRRGVADPFAACFKLAEVSGSQMAVDGLDLASIKADQLSSQFDQDFINEFMADPVTVYQALPAPVKELIRQIAANPAPKGMPAMGGDPQQELDPRLVNDLVS
jgi:hypothetical protein